MLQNEIMTRWDGLLALAYNTMARLVYRIPYKYKTDMKEMKNKHQGERCFIVANGPSIDSLDLTKLKNETVVCVNYMFRTKLFEDLKPKYYCITDSDFFKNKEHVDLLMNVDVDMTYFFSHRAAWIKEAYGQRRNVNIANCKLLANCYSKVKIQLHKISTGFHNATGFAIACALYMGFSEIYVAGLDFEPNGFKMTKSLNGVYANEPKRNENDYEMFEGLFEYLQAQHQFRYLNQVATKSNQRIYNVNSDSYVRAFDFIDYKEIF